MDCLATADFVYESYEEAHGRMALRPLMMTQWATPHKLLNDLLCKISHCEYTLLSVMNSFVQPCVCAINVAVPWEDKLSEYFLYFVL